MPDFHTVETVVMFDKGYLSNFYPAEIWLPEPVTGEMAPWPTNENYFQACKLECSMVVLDLIEMLAQFQQATPAQAKRLGRKLVIDTISWDYEVAPLAMMRCCMAKFTSHEELRQKLLATGTAPLIEHRPDPVWGDNLDGSGLNLLGCILELVRARVSI